MSGMGEALSDFIKALYWVVCILAALVVALLAAVVWLVLR